VPEALNSIVLRGLARDPGDRFATARDMADAVRAAVRPASTSDVSDWVEALAGEVLAARGSTVVAIDREEGRAPELAPPAERAAAAHRLDVVLHADVSRPAPARLLRHWPVAAAVAALAVAAFAARAPATVAPPVAHSPAQAAPTVALPSATPTEPLGTEPVDTEPSAAAPSPPASASSAPRKRGVPAPTRPRTTPPGRGGSCDPPYTTDADGTRIYKMQCL
jgi:serine/threonine-protein kinase